MAVDSVELNPGSGGAAIAVDEIDSKQHQLIKVEFGTDGSATMVDATHGLPVELVTLEAPLNVVGGGTEATALRVTLASDSTGVLSVDDNGGALTVDNGGTFAVQVNGDALTALQVMDDWDESDRAKVNPIVGQAGIAGGAGVVGATVPRVTLASDDPAVALLTTIDADTSAIKTAIETLDNAISGSEMQVDVVSSALPTGAATESTLAALAGYFDTEISAIVTAIQLLDNVISGSEAQVDVVSSALPTGASTEATLAAMSAKLPASLGQKAAAASASVVLASDQGAVPASQSGTWNVGTVTTVSAVTSITNALPAGTNNIGDVDVLSLPATPAGTNLIGKASAGLDSASIYSGTTALTPKFKNISTATSGDQDLIAAVSEKKIRVLALQIQGSGTAVSGYLSSDDSTGTKLYGDGTNKFVIDKSGATGPAGFALAFNPVGWFETDSGEALNLNLSAAQAVVGTITYVEA